MGAFPTTRWSLIRRSGDSPSGRNAAFGTLAAAYRHAILAYFRARLPLHEAEDATQSFLATSWENAWWARADEKLGSFRGFLLLLLSRHLGRARRGADAALVSDDLADVADGGPSPEHDFDTRFALTLTARALDSLRERYAGRGRAAQFDALLPLLSSRPDHGALRGVAERLDLPANTLTVELKRLRARLREQLRAELGELCDDEHTFQREWEALRRVLGADR